MMIQALLMALLLSVAGPPLALPDTRTDPPSEPGPPNIVVLMLDDHAFLDHRVWERLPNISSLFLDQGIEALNYWGNDPLCCPGRANFLTGQVSHVSGVIKNRARLLDPDTTIATELQAAGYYTNICGKYLNETKALEDKSPPGWDNVAVMGGGFYNYVAWVNDTVEPHGTTSSDYSTDVFAAHCDAFLQAAPADQPLFAFLTPYATHHATDTDGTADRYEPIAAPRHLDDERCAGIAPWKPANYNPTEMLDKPPYVLKRPVLPPEFADGFPLDIRCRSLLSVDEWLGQVVDELVAQGRFENTVFVLTGDNGMGYGAFRWALKHAPHTAQMPLFINWPAVTGTDFSQISNLLTNVDLAPTLCELAGCEMGPYDNGHPVDGQSFAGLIAPHLSSSVPTRLSIILERRGGRSPVWRGIMTDPVNHPRANQWLLIKYSSGAKELYDLSGGPCHAWQPGDPGDPCMLQNVTTTNPSVRKALLRQLARLW